MDKNLDDDRLVRLNRLRHLELRDICEGHQGASGFNQKPHARIKLSLKEEFASAWNTHRNVALETQAASCFDLRDTKVELHEDEVNSRALSAWINHTAPRITADLDEATRSWFTRVVNAAEGFDQFIGEVLHGAEA